MSDAQVLTIFYYDGEFKFNIILLNTMAEGKRWGTFQVI